MIRDRKGLLRGDIVLLVHLHISSDSCYTCDLNLGNNAWPTLGLSGAENDWYY